MDTENQMKPTIAVIGTGTMGSAIVRNLAFAGYRILIADPTPVRRDAVVAAIKKDLPNANIDILDCSREASWEADVIIPAIPYSAQNDVAAYISDVVTGKIVVSITNPLNQTYDGLVTAPGTSAAEELAQMLPHSKIVKAFNTVFSADFRTPLIAGKTADCFIAGDDADAITTVGEIVKDAGFNPVVAGALHISRTLESMMVLLIGLTMRNNYNWVAGWKILHSAA